MVTEDANLPGDDSPLIQIPAHGTWCSSSTESNSTVRVLDWPEAPSLDHRGVALHAQHLQSTSKTILVCQLILGPPFFNLMPKNLPLSIWLVFFLILKTQRALLHSISLDRIATCHTPTFDNSWGGLTHPSKKRLYDPKLNYCPKRNTKCVQDAYTR